MSSLSLATRGIISSDGGGGGGSVGQVPTVSSVSSVAGLVRVKFNVPCSLLYGGADPSRWLITGGPCLVLGVSFEEPDTVVLGTSEQATGTVYTVHVPDAVVQNPQGGSVSSSADWGFVGAGLAPVVYSGARESATSVLVTFSETMNPATAIDLANYQISPPLAVVGVEQVTDKQFRLSTARQAPATIYTVTVSGVLDLAGNPI